MTKFSYVLVIVALGCVMVIVSAFYRNEATQKEVYYYEVDTLAGNLRVPWQLAFLPDRSLIFTERTGAVRIFRKGRLRDQPVYKVPDIRLNVKMGLLGLAVHPDFSNNHFIYLAQNYEDKGLMRLKVIRYIMTGDTLLHPFVIADNLPANQNHTGCRLLFGPDKKLYITLGDADQPVQAQNLKAYNGKILRVNDDGTIPADNPFVKNDTALKPVWSYGHRNTQGLAFQPGSGLLFNAEHGPTGGDEINIIAPGANYGWPLMHHQMKSEQMVAPLLEYTPAIGPSEAIFYTGAMLPDLKNKLLVACLRGEGILCVTLHKNKPLQQEILFKKKFGRIRSVVTGPDGYLYISTSQYDMPEAKGTPPYDLILRIRPSRHITGLTAQPVAADIQPPQTFSTAGLYQQLCESCHGSRLQGTERAKAIVDGKFVYGSSRELVVKNIREGILNKGMPEWEGAVSRSEIDSLADYMIRLSKRK